MPSRRNDTSARSLLLGFSDLVLLGDQSNPWVLTLRGGYRGDRSNTAPLHPEAGTGTTFNIFSSFTTGGIAGNVACPFSPGLFIGIDRLNKVVAPGHALIPANSVISIANIQALSGLTPQQFADQASIAVGKSPGFFFSGPFGALTHAAIPPQLFPTSIDASFATPYTTSVGIGVQREIGKDLVVQLDYYHREINNLLGVRQSNLTFNSRAGAYFPAAFYRRSDRHVWSMVQRCLRRLHRQFQQTVESAVYAER